MEKAVVLAVVACFLGILVQLYIPSMREGGAEGGDAEEDA